MKRSKRSGLCDLENASINLRLLRDHFVKELTDIIVACNGDREAGGSGAILVIDPFLAGPLGLVIEVSVLKELGVEKLFYLDEQTIDHPAKNIIYLVRPEVKNMKNVVSQVTQYGKKSISKNFFLYFAPRRRMFCERILEDAGIYDDIKIGEFHLDLVPFDVDVLSMEMPTSFRDVGVHGDHSSLFFVAKAIMKLQFLFGIIPNIQGKGKTSQFITNMLFRMRKEMASEEPLIVPEIDRLILIDREADLVTPMVTQLTYEGLVDEMFGIFNSCVDLPASFIVDPSEDEKRGADPNRKIKTPLNSTDVVFRDVRDKNFAFAGPLLNQRAKVVEARYEDRHKAKSVQEVKAFMEKFELIREEHASIRVHTNVAGAILDITRDAAFRTQLSAEQNLLAGSNIEESMEYIQYCVNRQENVVKVLRLLCLYSLTNGGIPEKGFNFLRREILQSYGYRYIFTLDYLQRLGMRSQRPINLARAYSEGMITLSQRTIQFTRNRRDFNLIVDELDEQNPTDISFTYSGYAPLSIRLIEKALECPSPSNLQSQPADTSSIGNPFDYFSSSPEPSNNPFGSDRSNRNNGTRDRCNIPILAPTATLAPTRTHGFQGTTGAPENETTPGWGLPRVDSILNDVSGGGAFHASQELPKGLAGQKSNLSKNKVTLVFFVGGCTFTEIAALRFLSQQNEDQDFIVATTKMINGNTLIESLIPQFPH